MGTNLKNDKGQTPDNPWSYFAGPGDISSWARAHSSIRTAVGAQTASAADMPGAGEVAGWYEESERFETLTSPFGFDVLAEFGIITNEELVQLIVSSALDGERYLGQMRGYTGTPTPEGGPTGGTSGDNAPKEEPSIGKAWIWGIAAGLAGAWYLGRD